MINREDILDKAFHDCMHEMYAKSQPEADYDNLLNEYAEGKIGKDERIYDRHYLSMDEFLYIRDTYKDAYNIRSHWKDDVEVVEDYLLKGGLKDYYVPGKVDKNGFKHPAYRSTKKVPPIQESIYKILSNRKPDEDNNILAKKIADQVLENIKRCKDFYKFDREESSFDCDISLGASPTSNAETVKKWWKENYNQDIEIEERNPKLFWYLDNEYTDEELAYEFESYGENWKEALDKEWKEKKAEKKRKQDEKIAMLKNVNNNKK